MPLTVVEARAQLIIAALEKPMTMEQLRNAIGCNIYTLRKDMATLQNRGTVVPTGMVIDRKPTYRVASMRPVPELWRKAHNDYVNPISFQIAYAENPASKMPSMLAARYLYDAISELLALAASNDLENMEMIKELNQIRAKLKVSRQSLMEIVDMMEQLLGHPTWWTPENLKAITVDEEFDANEILTRHSTIISERDNA